MKRIESIEIENVKGIKKKKFDLDLIPNKPSLLVAPNGFGKSSFAIAFQSLTAGGIKLDKDSFHCNDQNNEPIIVVTYINTSNMPVTSNADKNGNSIKDHFDIFIINSRIVPKAKKLKISGTIIVTSSLEIAPITLINNVPEKATIPCTSVNIKARFGDNGKVVPNLGSVLGNCDFICALEDNVDFGKLEGARITKIIDDFISCISRLSGTKQQILKKAKDELLSTLRSNKQLCDIVEVLHKYGVKYNEESEFYIAAIEIAETVKENKDLWNKVAKYNQYIKEKKYYEEQFKAFSVTWKGIKPKEEKGKGLLVSFPKANQISNGERDVISFLTMLMQARTKLRKEKCILIIDEIFDYLDDANLIAAQYYLTQMIEEFKSAGKKLFPLIMTHLNPGYFKNFCFKDQKVYYLSKVATTNRALENIILNRDDPSLKDRFSRYFLHFHPDDIDLSIELTTLNLDPTYGTSSNFKTYICGELLKYIENKTYEPLSVCCAIRLKIEENTYLKLEERYRDDYLDRHTTVKKLDFAESKGVNVPDIYYILGIIYNDGLHLRKNADIVTPISSKLNNLTVKGMVRQI